MHISYTFEKQNTTTMNNYQITIGTESRIIKGENLKDARNTAQNIKFYNGYKGKTTVKRISVNQVFNYLKSL